MRANRTEQRVYYSDTDHVGVVYYANYLKWFEIGRTEILRENKLDYDEFERQGLIAPVVEVKCTFKDPAKYNDRIIIETKVEHVGNSSIKFVYGIIRKNDKKLLAEGYTVNVFVGMKTGKPARIPERLRKIFYGKN